MNINWAQKLSSRKLWIGLILLVVGVALCMTGDVENGVKVITLGCTGYLGAEAIVDIARAIWCGDSATEETEASE